jgi:hypothetical protein
VAVAPTHSRLAAFSAGGLEVEVHLWDIPYLVPFRIARPDPNEESSRTAFVHITDLATGLQGWGEGCADPYYGDTPETIAAVAPLLFSVALPAIEAALADAGGASTGAGYAAARGLSGISGRSADALAPMSAAMDLALGHHVFAGVTRLTDAAIHHNVFDHIVFVVCHYLANSRCACLAFFPNSDVGSFWHRDRVRAITFNDHRFFRILVFTHLNSLL